MQVLYYILLRTRKGNVSIAAMASKINPSVKPIIRNGSRINHTKGKRNIASKAIGQQMTNNIHQSRMAMNVRMLLWIQIVQLLAKVLPVSTSAFPVR
ncbi:MAG: hypothetical protein RIA63_05725 [Cyclobacteriaceae bacterium]